MALGKKTGGRKKGSTNKTIKAQRAELAASGLMPLDYMLGILRDPKADEDKRAWAADKAAPYCHPKLASMELGQKDGKPFVVKIVRFGDRPSGE